jgi:type VI secretion system protein ImpA
VATTQTAIDPILAPIAGPSPAGEDLQPTAEWHAIKEARRADDPFNKGDLQAAEPKVADWPLVQRLAASALATKGKDLRVAMWLTEANIRLNGLVGLRDSLRMIHGLIVTFWDGLYPLAEDGDLEWRAKPLSWIDDAMPELALATAITRRGDKDQDYSYHQYQDSRKVGFEKDVLNQNGDVDADKALARKEALDAGKISGEMFEAAVKATTRAAFEEVAAEVDECAAELRQLDTLVEEKFGPEAPGFAHAKEALQQIKSLLANILLKKRQEEPGAPVSQPEPSAAAAAAPELGLRPTLFIEDSGDGSWKHAQSLVAAGRVAEGLAEMTRLAAQEHGRAGFLRRLELAEICLNTNRQQVAVLVLEELAEKITALNLTAWESPEIIGRVWGRLYRIYRKNSDERASEMYVRLCRLNPWQALRWSEE